MIDPELADLVGECEKRYGPDPLDGLGEQLERWQFGIDTAAPLQKAPAKATSVGEIQQDLIRLERQDRTLQKASRYLRNEVADIAHLSDTPLLSGLRKMYQKYEQWMTPQESDTIWKSVRCLDIPNFLTMISRVLDRINA